MIAVDGKYPSRIRMDSIAKLTDQAVLTKIAVEDKYSGVRATAVAKLTDQALLEKFAVQDKDSGVRLGAIANLTNQTVLTKIAGDMRIFASDSFEAAARLHLALQDPIVSMRIPNAKFSTLYNRDTKYYSKYIVFPNGDKSHAFDSPVAVGGEIITFTVSQGSKCLAQDTWRSYFPSEDPPSFISARVTVKEMIGQLFGLPEFTQVVLLELTKSSIPEVRAGALASRGYGCVIPGYDPAQPL